MEIERAEGWHVDPRVPADEQTGPEVYARNDLDRGHLVRRRDPVWGSIQTATRANAVTFCYVNAAPQAGEFNSDETLWAGLENDLLDHARQYGSRLSVFTAPVLDPDDPPYRGVQIPRLFWKIAAWATHADPATSGIELAATGDVLDQTPRLDNLELASRRALETQDPPPLDPFRTFQVPVRHRRSDRSRPRPSAGGGPAAGAGADRVPQCALGAAAGVRGHPVVKPRDAGPGLNTLARRARAPARSAGRGREAPPGRGSPGRVPNAGRGWPPRAQ